MKIVLKFTIVLLFLFQFSHASYGQALNGIPGLVNIPTADFMKDGTFYVGASYLPKQTLLYSKYNRDGLVFFSCELPGYGSLA